MSDEPITKITRAVDTALSQQNHRRSDRVFNDYVRPLIAPAIIALVGGCLALGGTAIFLWVDVQVLKAEVTKLQATAVTNKDNISDLKSFQSYKIADIATRLEKLEDMARRK